jgi:uncharacterized protein
MRSLFAFLAGLVFGLGLVISGMANPAKVLNFLDVAGAWDPSLAFVMAGAAAVTFIGYRLAWRQSKPMLGDSYDAPSSTAIDRPLVAGAAIFGIGWGVSGYCPGPALTALPLLAPGTVVFVPAMLLGLWLGGFSKNLPPFSPRETAT